MDVDVDRIIEAITVRLTVKAPARPEYRYVNARPGREGETVTEIVGTDGEYMLSLLEVLDVVNDVAWLAEEDPEELVHDTESYVEQIVQPREWRAHHETEFNA